MSPSTLPDGFVQVRVTVVPLTVAVRLQGTAGAEVDEDEAAQDLVDPLVDEPLDEDPLEDDPLPDEDDPLDEDPLDDTTTVTELLVAPCP